VVEHDFLVEILGEGEFISIFIPAVEVGAYFE
jgi:hypothetical protein